VTAFVCVCIGGHAISSFCAGDIGKVRGRWAFRGVGGAEMRVVAGGDGGVTVRLGGTLSRRSCHGGTP